MISMISNLLRIGVYYLLNKEMHGMNIIYIVVVMTHENKYGNIEFDT